MKLYTIRNREVTIMKLNIYKKIIVSGLSFCLYLSYVTKPIPVLAENGKWPY